MKDKSFCTTGNKGFKITLPNGVTVSTQFGYCNYSDNCYGHEDCKEDDHFKFEREANKVSSDTAEIAIFAKDCEWITEKYMEQSKRHEHADQVIGYVDVNEWLEIIDWARSYE